MNVKFNQTITEMVKKIIAAEGTENYKKVIDDVLTDLYNMKNVDIEAIENKWIICCEQVNKYFDSHGKSVRLPSNLFRQFVNSIRIKKGLEPLSI